MPITATDFLLSAESCLDGGKETDYRTATSRAYYSAYHMAIAQADGCPSIDHLQIKGGLHQRLISRYELFVKNNLAKSISYILSDMRKKRVAADYHLGDLVTKSDAEIQVKSVRRLEEKLNAFAQSVKNPAQLG